MGFEYALQSNPNGSFLTPPFNNLGSIFGSRAREIFLESFIVFAFGSFSRPLPIIIIINTACINIYV